jgi:hypothetical protein
MDFQNAQYSNQTAIQNSELNALLLRDMLDQEAHNAFSQAFPYSTYDSMVMKSNSEGSLWPVQASDYNNSATDQGEPPRIQVDAQSAVAHNTTVAQDLGQVYPNFDERFTSLEGRINGLEVVIQDLRSE